MPHLQSKVQRWITIKARLQNKECQRLFIKVSLKFLFRDGSVSCHPNVTRQTVPFCRSGEREGTFSEFLCAVWVSSRRCCIIVSKMTYNVSSGTLNTTIPYHCWTQTWSTTVYGWQAHQFSEICWVSWLWCISRHSLNLLHNCTGNQHNCASAGVMGSWNRRPMTTIKY